MGGSKTYNPNGGFTEQSYKQVGTTANDIKIIAKKSDNKSTTPAYSNTPYTMYAKVDSKSGVVDQVSVYGNGTKHRAKAKDIDIGHPHTNRDDNRSFSETDIHVHEYNSNGVRSKKARKPSKKERRLLMIARYGKRKS